MDVGVSMARALFGGMWLALLCAGCDGCDSEESPAAAPVSASDLEGSSSGGGPGAMGAAACGAGECSAACPSQCDGGDDAAGVQCGTQRCEHPFADLAGLALPIPLPRACCTAQQQCGIVSGSRCVPPEPPDPRCPEIGQPLSPALGGVPCCVGNRCGITLLDTGCLELTTIQAMLGAANFIDIEGPIYCDPVTDDAGTEDAGR
jgi:hypothetical protein